MKVNEIARQITSSISSSIETYGFKLNHNTNEFKRRINHATQIFELVFYKEGNYLKIKPEVRIKIKPIEDIYQQVSKRGDVYRTLGNDLFEILRYIDCGEETGKGEQYYWIIKDDESINKLIKIIPEYFKETILPYFENNSTLSKVDELLNKYPRELSIHNWLYPLRANLAIIAAKLNNNPKFEELVKIYEEELKEAEESYKTEFVKLKNILHEITV